MATRKKSKRTTGRAKAARKTTRRARKTATRRKSAARRKPRKAAKRKTTAQVSRKRGTVRGKAMPAAQKAMPAQPVKMFDVDAAPRCRSRIPVEIDIDGRIERGAIADMSASGVRIVGPQVTLPAGKLVQIRFGAGDGSTTFGTPAMGTVASRNS